MEMKTYKTYLFEQWIGEQYGRENFFIYIFENEYEAIQDRLDRVNSDYDNEYIRKKAKQDMNELLDKGYKYKSFMHSSYDAKLNIRWIKFETDYSSLILSELGDRFLQIKKSMKLFEKICKFSDKQYDEYIYDTRKPDLFLKALYAMKNVNECDRITTKNNATYFAFNKGVPSQKTIKVKAA